MSQDAGSPELLKSEKPLNTAPSLGQDPSLAEKPFFGNDPGGAKWSCCHVRMARAALRACLGSIRELHGMLSVD